MALADGTPIVDGYRKRHRWDLSLSADAHGRSDGHRPTDRVRKMGLFEFQSLTVFGYIADALQIRGSLHPVVFHLMLC